MAEPSSTRSPLPQSPPSRLLGREEEQRRLVALLAATEEGRGHLVLVGGEAGIGKTAFVRFATEAAAVRGWTVLIGHCYDLSVTPPYGPWRELLTRRSPDDDRLPLPIGLFGDDEMAPESQAALFQQVVNFFTSLVAERPVVAVLEDLHWTDSASIDLLRFLARQLADLPLLLIATYRTDEITRRHPLEQLLPTLLREAPTERIDLRRLGDAAVQALVARGHPLLAADTERLASYLKRSAEGNPFFALELLRNLKEEGVLRPGEPHRELGALDRVRAPTLLLIAAALYIARKTASDHVSNILRRLGVANRAEAAALAVRDGLV